MIGILIGLIGTFFLEIQNSITKNVSIKYNIEKIGVISSFFSVIFFVFTLLYKYFFTNIEIYLNPDSIFLLIIRGILEITLAYLTLIAIKNTERSTFGVIRILTIPLLLIIDILLGYSFSIYSYIGISIILLSFFIFNFRSKTLNLKGWEYIVIISILASITISLFKYSITHYGNSVEVDQSITLFGIFIFFLIYNFKKNKCFALNIIKKEKSFIYLGLSMGISTLLISYSYLYLNASEATVVKRGLEMFWSIVFGFLVFKENNFIKKIFFAICIIVGLIVMVL